MLIMDSFSDSFFNSYKYRYITVNEFAGSTTVALSVCCSVAEPLKGLGNIAEGVVWPPNIKLKLPRTSNKGNISQ